MTETKSMLGPSSAYTDILHHAIEKNAAEKAKGKYLPLRPSSSGKCTRELAYAMMTYLGKADYEIEEMEPRIKMLLDLGHFVEKHMNKWMWEAKEWFRSKYKDQVVDFYALDASQVNEVQGDELRIEGEIDDCFWSPVHKAIIDYKSKGDKFDKAHKSNWDETNEKLASIAHQFSPTGFWVENLEEFLEKLNDPHFAGNFLQLNGYANTDFIKSKGVDHAAIIQYNKNDSRLREVRFKPCEKMYLKVKEKFQVALDAAGAGEPEQAPRDFSLGSVKCAFCPYKKQCYPELGEKDSMKAYFKTLPPKKWPTNTKDLGIWHKELEELFVERDAALNHAAALKILDDKILVILRNLEQKKIRLDNGHIYMVKSLKSPYPREELRRGKL